MDQKHSGLAQTGKIDSTFGPATDKGRLGMACVTSAVLEAFAP